MRLWVNPIACRIFVVKKNMKSPTASWIIKTVLPVVNELQVTRKNSTTLEFSFTNNNSAVYSFESNEEGQLNMLQAEVLTTKKKLPQRMFLLLLVLHALVL